MSITTKLLKQPTNEFITVQQAGKKLTRKQMAFVQYLLDHPKASATEAYLAAYPTDNRDTARAEASTTLAKPNVLAVLNGAATEAEETLHSVMQSAKRFSRKETKVGAAFASVARASANDILDRVHGKATQRVEQSSTVVQVNIDLTTMS